jgi:hypothetical protein
MEEEEEEEDDDVINCSPLSTCVLYRRLQRAKIPDDACMQFLLLKMGMLMSETCRG